MCLALSEVQAHQEALPGEGGKEIGHLGNPALITCKPEHALSANLLEWLIPLY